MSRMESSRYKVTYFFLWQIHFLFAVFYGAVYAVQTFERMLGPFDKCSYCFRGSRQ